MTFREWWEIHKDCTNTPAFAAEMAWDAARAEIVASLKRGSTFRDAVESGDHIHPNASPSDACTDIADAIERGLL